MPDSLIDRLKAGTPTFAAWCGLPEPSLAGLLAAENFDAVVLDMQHSAIDFTAAIAAIPLVAAAGKPAIVRVPVGEFTTASRVLDAGASAVIAPMINTIEDARRFANYMKFPPLGERSWGPHGALSLTGLGAEAYFKAANGLTVSLAMVETAEALAIIDDILAVPGIDGIFIGPGDLSISLSKGQEFNPFSKAVDQALDHVIQRVRKAGKVAGIYGAWGDHAANYARKGFHLISVAGDGTMLRTGAQAALKAARS